MTATLTPLPEVAQTACDEWLRSGVASDLIRINLRILNYEQCLEALLYNPSLKADWDYWVGRYSHLRDGGWACGATPRSQWACLKPTTPRWDVERQREIKYEIPLRQPAELFKPGVSLRIWQKVADRYGLSMPDGIKIGANGEAQGFWEWVAGNPCIVVVPTEGVKKVLCSLSRGICAIGASGCWGFIRSPKDADGNRTGSSHLHRQLMPFIHPDRKFVFALDQDNKQQSIRAVNEAITATTNLLNRELKRYGGIKPETIKVATWDSKFKGIDDLKVGAGDEAVEEALLTAKPFLQWRLDQLRRLTYPVNHSFSTPKFDHIAIPNAIIIGLKGAKSSGKTWLLEQWCKQWLAEGKKILLPSHRRNLAKHLAKRLGISYVEEVEGDSGEIIGLALCIDSLHARSKARFEPSDWAGCLVIIDEAEQQIWHTLEADTEVRKHRVKILENLRAVVQNAANFGGKIILSDADLCDLSIDFIKGLLGFDASTYIIENTHQPPHWDIYNYPGKDPRYVVAEIEKRLAEGQRLIVHTSAQKIKAKWSTQNLEKRFKTLFPNLAILRVDAESLGNPNHEAFGAIDRLNELLQTYDLILCSPAVETGVSIEPNERFDAVFGICGGVQTTDAVRQTLARDRDPVERHIWVKQTGVCFIGNRSTDYREIKHSQDKTTRELIGYLQRADSDPLDEEVDIEFLPTATDTWAKRAAITNAGMWAYRETILRDLTAEGHTIIQISEEELKANTAAADTINNELKYQAKIDYQEECEAIASSPDINEDEAQRINESTSRLPEENQALRKFKLTKKYQVEITPELVENDDDGWYPQILLHYLSTVGNCYLPNHDRRIASQQIASGEGSIYKRDFNQRQMSRKVALLEKLGVPKLFEMAEIHPHDPIVKQVAGNCAEASHDIKRVHGKTLKDLDKATSIVAQMLALVDLKIPFLRQETVEIDGKKKRIRVYGKPAPGFLRDPQTGKLAKDKDGKPIPVADERIAIFDAWRNRDSERVAQADLQRLIEKLEGCKDLPEYTELRQHPRIDDAWQHLSSDAQERIIAICNNNNSSLKTPQIPKEYIILDPSNSDEYEGWVEYVRLASGLSLDIETFGEGKHDALHPWKGSVRLIQVSDGILTFIADFGGRFDDRTSIRTAHEGFLSVLGAKLQDPDTVIAGHNIHFDLRMLATQFGLRYASNVWDTLLGFRVFFGDYGKQGVLPSFGLGYLVKRFLKLDIDKAEQKSDWGAPLTSEQLEYASTDAGATWHLFQKLLAIYDNPAAHGFGKLAQPGLLQAWVDENNAIAPAIEIELAGLPIDRDIAKQTLSQVESLIAGLMQQWDKICPSIKPSQVGKLKDYLNREYRLGLSNLDKASLALHKDNPIVLLRLKINALETQANQLKALLRSSERDGRVHTVYHTLTGFGRFSSGESKKFDDLPNLQSISAKSNPLLNEFALSKVRECIRPKPGRVMAVIDLAGAHGRIAADQAQDPVAIQGNNDPTIDNHSKVAAFVAKAQGLDWAWEHIAKASKDKSHPDHTRAKLFRDTAKNTYYGWLNGAGALRIQEQITSNTGVKPSLEACKAAIKGCEALYPKVVEFRNNLMERLKASAVKIGQAYFAVNRMDIVGSRLLQKLGVLADGSFDVPYTQALAAIWSRIEASAVKRALPKLLNLQLSHPEWGLQLINYVHDEVDIEVCESFAQQAITAVNDIVGDEFQRVLEFVHDGRGRCWEQLVAASWADK